MAKEHTKNARPSNWEKHQKGQARKRRDAGGEGRQAAQGPLPPTSAPAAGGRGELSP
jgi:hypothetical protein